MFSRRSSATTLSVLVVAVTSYAMLQSMVVPALGPIRDAFGTDTPTATWVLTAYLLSSSISTPLLGRLGDAHGKVRVLASALAVMAVGCLAAVLAPDIGWLVAARVVQGVSGGVMPLAFGIVRDEFGRRMNRALGVVASLGAVGFGLGIVVAGPLVERLGVDAVFWPPLVFGAAAAPAALLLLRESPHRTAARLPVVPATLLAGWLVALLLGLSKGGSWGWSSPRVLGCAVAVVVLGTGWAIAERRAAVPFVDLAMLRRRGIWTANVVAGCMGAGMFATLGFVPQLVHAPAPTGFGASISASGYVMLPTAVASLVLGLTTSSFVARFGARRVVLAGLAAMTASLACLAAFQDALWQVYVATTVQGVATGLVTSSLAGVVAVAVPPDQTGVANGTNANIRTIGGSVGTATAAAILAAHGGAAGEATQTGYRLAFLVLAALSVPALVAAAFVPREERAQQPVG